MPPITCMVITLWCFCWLKYVVIRNGKFWHVKMEIDTNLILCWSSLGQLYCVCVCVFCLNASALRSCATACRILWIIWCSQLLSVCLLFWASVAKAPSCRCINACFVCFATFWAACDLRSPLQPGILWFWRTSLPFNFLWIVQQEDHTSGCLSC